MSSMWPRMTMQGWEERETLNTIIKHQTKMETRSFTGERSTKLEKTKTEQAHVSNRIQLKQLCGPGCSQQITK